ncbi:hypothetical protein OS122_25260 [Mycolicibacterium mucogenicum]|nr:hypothetical protein [Mycolicibacterium mucogenicum]MCX8564203.1 hypothetical protein [Mycolicibacterium mucogenicum]
MPGMVIAVDGPVAAAGSGWLVPPVAPGAVVPVVVPAAGCWVAEPVDG